MNAHLNKSIALIVAVIAGIVLLHNLYLYEINYGTKPVYSTDTEKVQVNEVQENDGAKGFSSVVIVLNLLSLSFILIDYFQQSKDYRSFRFDPMEMESSGLSVVVLLTYILDTIIVVALLSYLVYIVT